MPASILQLDAHPCRRLFGFGLMVSLGLGACAKEEERVPDGAWDVTVESRVVDNSLATDCVATGAVYSKKYRYELYFDGETAEVEIDGEAFARGSRSGCSLSYVSAIWLEEREEGDLRWQITGNSTYEGEISGCDLPENLDWQGDELIEIVESTVPGIPTGCTYEMVTRGTWVSGG
jgi:hypothetical protein